MYTFESLRCKLDEVTVLPRRSDKQTRVRRDRNACKQSRLMFRLNGNYKNQGFFLHGFIRN